MSVRDEIGIADAAAILAEARAFGETFDFQHRGDQISGDAANQLSFLQIIGADRNNTDSGTLYWSLTNSAGTRTFSLYKDSAKASGDKVAEGSLAGDGRITLTESNGSGMTGYVTVTYSTNDVDSGNTINAFTTLYGIVTSERIGAERQGGALVQRRERNFFIPVQTGFVVNTNDEEPISPGDLITWKSKIYSVVEPIEKMDGERVYRVIGVQEKHLGLGV